MLFFKIAYYKWLWQAFTSELLKFHPTSFSVMSKFSSHVHLDAKTALNRCEVGSYSYISKETSMIRVTVGRYCSIGPECKIGMGSHPTNLISTSPVFFSKSNKIGISLIEEECYEEFKPIEIGHDVWIGSRAMIMGGCHIGNGAIVAAGAVVIKDVKPYSIVGGIPAKEIKMRFDAELIELLERSKWWLLNHQKLKEIFNLVCEGNTEWNQEITKNVSKYLIEQKGRHDE